jgi:hypothetical protein
MMMAFLITTFGNLAGALRLAFSTVLKADVVRAAKKAGVKGKVGGQALNFLWFDDQVS